jgi:hypothetical protein
MTPKNAERFWANGMHDNKRDKARRLIRLDALCHC